MTRASYIEMSDDDVYFFLDQQALLDFSIASSLKIVSWWTCHTTLTYFSDSSHSVFALILNVMSLTVKQEIPIL
jgi:hypothetical protein